VYPEQRLLLDDSGRPMGATWAASDKKDQKLMVFDPVRKQWSLRLGNPLVRRLKYVYYQHLYTGEEQAHLPRPRQR
jgi:hypothetical protein